MKKLLDYIVLVFSMMVFCATLANSSAVYYYDNTDGLDTNNGLLPTCAWKTASKLRTTIAANDDTYLFNGGQEFSGRFLLFKNGWKVSSYGTGQAILKDGIYSTDTNAEIADTSIYNLAFSITSSNYPIYLRGASGFRVYNNTIDCNHIGASYNGIRAGDTATYAISSHDNLIYNNNITDCYGGIVIDNPTYDNQIYGNFIETYGGTDEDAILVGGMNLTGDDAYDNLVYDNSIYCSGAGGIDIGGSDNSNGINLGYKSSNNFVYDNSIYGTCTSGIQFDRLISDANYVYNNVINNAYSGIRVWTYTIYPSNNANILNNTIIAGSYSTYGIWLRCGSTGSGTLGQCEREGTIIKNNIITSYDATYAMLIDVGDGGDPYIPDISNNVYYNLGSSGDVFTAMLDTTPYTDLGDWQTDVGETGSMLADASLGDDHLDASYKPESDFPGINNGLTFDSIFTTDYDGYTRAGLWDIGAYEFHQGGTPGNRVTLKRITIK